MANQTILTSRAMVGAVAKGDWMNIGLSSPPAKLYRSDFFPGLGWMMTKTLWQELQPKWPERYWDDWMREPAQRKGR